MSIVGIDSSVLLSLFQSRAGIGAGTGVGAPGTATGKVPQPTAPWATEPTAAQTSAL
jgi:hypothetical protein